MTADAQRKEKIMKSGLLFIPLYCFTIKTCPKSSNYSQTINISKMFCFLIGKRAWDAVADAGSLVAGFVAAVLAAEKKSQLKKTCNKKN